MHSSCLQAEKGGSLLSVEPYTGEDTLSCDGKLGVAVLQHLAGSFVRRKVARGGGHGLEDAGQVALEVAQEALLHKDATHAVQKAVVAAEVQPFCSEALHLKSFLDQVERVDERLGDDPGQRSARHTLADAGDVGVIIKQDRPQVGKKVVEAELEAGQRANLEQGGQHAAVKGPGPFLPPHEAHRLGDGRVRLGFQLCHESGPNDIKGVRNCGAHAPRGEATREVDSVAPSYHRLPS